VTTTDAAGNSTTATATHDISVDTTAQVTITAVNITSAFDGTSILSGSYVSTGANSIVSGSVMSTTYTSVGAHATVNGSIFSGTYTSTGDTGNVSGSIMAGTYATTGASSIIGGEIDSVGAITLGALSTSSSQNVIPAVLMQKELAADLQRAHETQVTLNSMGTGTALAATMPVDMTLNAGIYSAASFSTTAGTTLTLDGQGLANQTWIFNITDILAIGASTKVELFNAGPGASVVWNVTNGYASIGASATFLGTIFAENYITVGALTVITGPNGTNGGLFAHSGLVSLGDGAQVGTQGYGISAANIVTGTAVSDSLVTIHLGNSVLGTTQAGHDGNFSYALTTFNVVTLGQSTDKSITASIEVGASHVTSDPYTYNDMLHGSVGNDVLYGTVGPDTIEGGIGNDLLIGGHGADTLIGGDGIDTFVFNQGDSIALFTGSGSKSFLSGFDVITDFKPASGSLHGELLSFPGTAVVAQNSSGVVDGVDSSNYGQQIGSHATINGVVSFYSDNSGATAVSLDSPNKVAAALDYLMHNDLGSAGTTVAFKASADTYVYSQNSTDSGATGSNNYSLVKLAGVDALGLTTDAHLTTNKFILID